MELKRSTLVQSVLDSVDAASQAQLRRGPRVTFSDDGEIGDDQGGVTREMFAEFARRCALPDPGEMRLLKVTPANHVQPEPAEPDCNDSATGSGTGIDVQYGRHYQNLGRVCGMALAFAPRGHRTLAPVGRATCFPVRAKGPCPNSP